MTQNLLTRSSIRLSSLLTEEDRHQARIYSIMHATKLKNLHNLTEAKQQGQRTPITPTLAPAFLNISNATLSEQETKLLSRGPKFPLPRST